MSVMATRKRSTKKTIVKWDIDEAFSLCSTGRGEPACVYWMSAKGPRGYYLTVVVDAGHFVETMTKDDGPFPKDSEAFLAGLYAAADWFYDNDLKFSKRDFEALKKRAPSFDRGSASGFAGGRSKDRLDSDGKPPQSLNVLNHHGWFTAETKSGTLGRSSDVLKKSTTGHLVDFNPRSFYQTNNNVTLARYRIPGYGYKALAWFDNATGERIA